MTIKTFETDFSGTSLKIEYGRMAKQAGAAVTAQMGDTVVMATATMSGSARPGMNFFPLMVDYEERFYAAGRIKGPRFTKREGRPTTDAVLTGRMIDRGIRPLFPEGMRNDVQVVIMPLCIDGVNKPDIVGMIAATLALHISNIPFNGPVAGVRIGMVTGDFIINPTPEEIEFSELQMVVMGDGKKITMVDCDAKELDDKNTIQAFEVAMKAMAPITKFMDDIRKEIGKEKLKDSELQWIERPAEGDLKIIEEMRKAALPHMDKYLFNTPVGSKGERKQILLKVKDILVEEFRKKLTTKERTEEEAEAYLRKLLGMFFSDFIDEQVTKAILESDKRVDGRKLDEIRPLSAEVGILPRSHGTGLFSRGETQVLTVATLGAPGDDMIYESMEGEGKKKFFHHYNFLGFSVGEVKPIRGAGRREIGHGMLAEKALIPVLPRGDQFPYTIRLVSEIMGSNGSSSMGSTVGSTLALLDAGVPITRPVVGIAMGMASDGKTWKVLTDIQDMEDGTGGMDFKFTSTSEGLTAIQMDTKTLGIDKEIIKATFKQMRKAIKEILKVVEKAIPAPRENISAFAPRIISMKIDPDRIGAVVGTGGKVIRGLTEEYGVQIDIEDDGTVLITSTDAAKAMEVQEVIAGIVRVVEIGDVFEGVEVVKLMRFGAFVKLTPSTDALVPISEISYERVPSVEAVLAVGDKVNVKVIRLDKGKVDASIKALLPKPEGYVEPPPRRSFDSRGGDRRSSFNKGRRSSDRRGPPPQRRD